MHKKDSLWSIQYEHRYVLLLISQTTFPCYQRRGGAVIIRKFDLQMEQVMEHFLYLARKQGWDTWLYRDLHQSIL